MINKFHGIDNHFFSENRKAFCSKMLPNAISIFFSNFEYPRTGDENFKFKQNADLFYLTGLNQEDTALVLFPDSPNPDFREMLFVKKTNEHIAVWDGHKYNKEEAKEVSGIQSVFWMDDLPSMLPQLFHYAENIYINTNENDRASNPIEDRNVFEGKKLQERYPFHHFVRSAPMLREMRMKKKEAEVALIKKAIQITGDAFHRVMKMVQPGLKEYEIEAEIIHEFIRQGSEGHAFSPIIASGKNACVLHYIQNTDTISDGDMILLDFGAEYCQYNADMTRCLPANGVFSPRQKEVYRAVLRAMKHAKTMLVCGTKLDDYHKEMGLFIEKELLRLKLIDTHDIQKQDPKNPAYKKYFMHGVSHALGLDVHDINHRYQALDAGNVFTCEPGIYIKEEGIGVRLENDILITSSGNVDLMEEVPIEIEEIEDIMNVH